MKKFAAYLLILSLGLFTIGCGGTEETPKPDSTTPPTTETGTGTGTATPETPEAPEAPEAPTS